MIYEYYGWLILIVLFVIAELATSVSLVTIWFIPPAIISAFMRYFGFSLTTQIISFLILSMICLLSTRPIINKFRTNKKLLTNLDSKIGNKYKIISVDENNIGTIKINDIIWSVKCDEKLYQNDEIIIVEIIGNCFNVKKTEENQIKS